MANRHDELIHEKSDASFSAAVESGPANKMRPLDVEWGRSQTTAGATDVIPVLPSGHRPVWDRDRRQVARIISDHESYKDYRRICDGLAAELRHASSFLVDGEMSDEGLELVVEVEALLDHLYGCPWGVGESLKRVVVAINSQVNNTRWTERHINFLRDIAAVLRRTYLVDERTVDECYDLMKEHQLDPFRGTLTDTDAVKTYRIVEAEQS